MFFQIFSKNTKFIFVYLKISLDKATLFSYNIIETFLAGEIHYIECLMIELESVGYDAV